MVLQLQRKYDTQLATFTTITTTMNWQPLDTAPRDGTHILFFCGDANAIFTAWYSKEYDYSYTGIEAGTPQEIAMYKYWHIASVDEDFPQYFDTENPANCYWQPLPELPL